MGTEQKFWRRKLAAWVHDPVEKAIVLFREAHEAGTVAALRQELFGSTELPGDLDGAVREADHWAAAADRPKFPGERSANRLRVDWVANPALIHPLSGTTTRIASLVEDFDVSRVKAVSIDHFRDLIMRTPDGQVDYRKTFLRFWRHGPESPAKGFGALWNLLPADTRIPDHGIFEHLRLASCFAGALVDEAGPALLCVSLGPVQGFITQARTTSDLWAGSHLLSRLTWEAMRPVVDELGPDAILLPDLLGVPIVDLWLKEQGIELGDEPRRQVQSDANPLFSPSLPNRFVALVPRNKGKELAQSMIGAVREWAAKRAEEAWARILDEVQPDDRRSTWEDTGKEQIMAQLADFPEIHWALVPWPREGAQGDATLSAMLESLFEPAEAKRLARGNPALAHDIDLDGTEFYRPNPGLRYPAVYRAADKALAAAKATRAFEPVVQTGYRCSLCGEREWLTGDRAELERPSQQRTDQAIWAKLGEVRPAWSRNESLCALCTLKRLWPVLFVTELKKKHDLDLSRYVVSTHAMALAPTLEKLACHQGGGKSWEALRDLARQAGDRAALPRKLALATASDASAEIVRSLPIVLDEAREAGDQGKLRVVAHAIEDLLGHRMESYYGLILLDGDQMGRWVAGDALGVRLRDIFHPDVQGHLDARARDHQGLHGYLSSPRPLSPGYHVALSRALNHFALHVAPAIVEDCHLGKLLYAGGDDLLAMVGLDDLLEVAADLRAGYRGDTGSQGPADGAGPRTGGAPGTVGAASTVGTPGRVELRFRSGYALLKSHVRRQLLRVMGEHATASLGIVVAHHMAPLQAVLRELRAAERRAKAPRQEPGSAGHHARGDAFSISLLKRSGGAIHLTCPFVVGGRPAMPILVRLRDAFARDLSRQAAYHLLAWLPALPAARSANPAEHAALRELLESQLRYQFGRHLRPNRHGATEQLASLASDVASLALDAAGPRSPGEFLAELVGVAEFLAREGRVAPEPESAGAQAPKEASHA